MKLTFLGTRGEIEARTRRHRMHSSLLVSYREGNVMIDCGLDWLGKFERLRPSAIILTHAHPDHAWGLKNGAPCPVHAPEKAWQSLKNCRVEDRHLIKERVATKICGITFEAFPVEHSILAPAVAYRISAGRACIFYGPDLLFIHDRSAALTHVQSYIGDGATMTRSCSAGRHRRPSPRWRSGSAPRRRGRRRSSNRSLCTSAVTPSRRS